MQLQFALSTLLLASLFALPAAAAEVTETDESKKQRWAAKLKQNSVTTENATQAAPKSAKVEDAFEREDAPKDFYKGLGQTSF